MPKILVSSTDVMMYLFLLPHVQHLSKFGYSVDVVVASAKEFSSEGYADVIRQALPVGSCLYEIQASRNPFSILNYVGYKHLKKILNKSDYDLVWTNEPVMGAITRLAAKSFRKAGGRVLYMAHGFHFFNGGPMLNWIFYPVEKFLAKYSDIIVVINQMDYELAKVSFSLPVKHIHGIGFPLERFAKADIDRVSKRGEIGVGEDDFMILSVGELNGNKNHKVIIRSLALLKIPKVKYVVCGVGSELASLRKLVEELNLIGSVLFLGLRYDVHELLKTADVFVHPSYREGLGIAPLEAMASGLPIVTSNRHGIRDYSISDVTGFTLDPDDAKGFAGAIDFLYRNPDVRSKISLHNLKAVQKYSLQESLQSVELIIQDVMCE